MILSFRRRLIVVIGMLLVFNFLVGCSPYIALAKPRSGGYAELQIVTMKDGKPAVVLTHIRTLHDIQDVELVTTTVTRLYLRAGDYEADVSCAKAFTNENGISTTRVKIEGDAPDDNYRFSVEADRVYVFDCTATAATEKFTLHAQ